MHPNVAKYPRDVQHVSYHLTGIMDVYALHSLHQAAMVLLLPMTCFVLYHVVPMLLEAWLDRHHRPGMRATASTSKNLRYLKQPQRTMHGAAIMPYGPHKSLFWSSRADALDHARGWTAPGLEVTVLWLPVLVIALLALMSMTGLHYTQQVGGNVAAQGTIWARQWLWWWCEDCTCGRNPVVYSFKTRNNV